MGSICRVIHTISNIAPRNKAMAIQLHIHCVSPVSQQVSLQRNSFSFLINVFLLLFLLFFCLFVLQSLMIILEEDNWYINTNQESKA